MPAISANTEAPAAFQKIVYLNSQMDRLNQKMQKIGHWNLELALKHRVRSIASSVGQAARGWQKRDVEVVYLCRPESLSKFVNSSKSIKTLYTSMLPGKTKTEIEKCLPWIEFIVEVKAEIEADPAYFEDKISALVKREGPDVAKAILRATPEFASNHDSIYGAVKDGLKRRGESNQTIIALTSKW